MYNRIYIVILIGLVCVMSACKTNEVNMNDAYQKAIAGREATKTDLDSIVYNSVRKEMKHGTMIVKGDTVDVSTQWVRITQDGGGIPENIKPYCVVVAQFKQIFNAKSMRERLLSEGYPGAFLVETREPYYFVIAASFNEASDAVALLEKVSRDTNLKLKEPCPFILQPAQTIR